MFSLWFCVPSLKGGASEQTQGDQSTYFFNTTLLLKKLCYSNCSTALLLLAEIEAIRSGVDHSADNAMPNTCCVKGCKSNYLTAVKSEGPTPVYCFPEIKDDRNRWLTAVGRDDVTAAFMKFEEEEFEVNKNGKLTKKIKKKPQYFVC